MLDGFEAERGQMQAEWNRLEHTIRWHVSRRDSRDTFFAFLFSFFPSPFFSFSKKLSQPSRHNVTDL